jgi:hypothetical protein
VAEECYGAGDAVGWEGYAAVDEVLFEGETGGEIVRSAGGVFVAVCFWERCDGRGYRCGECGCGRDVMGWVCSR